ncbi:MAG: lipopolysaccharide kinase InaA family protein [Sedimenticolaceae bacterium]
MQDFITEEWKLLAIAGHLNDFESIWGQDIGWFEEPNQRRGGWSGVSRLVIERPDAGPTAVFIKRQQNHVTRTWRHPARGITTFRREFENLQWLQAVGVPTLDVLYFAERTSGDDRQAILISRELTGYVSLEDHISDWQQHGFPERPVWHKLIRKLAGIASHMHKHHIQQNCFLPKHVFVAGLDGEIDIRLIDFEKAKRRLTVDSAMLRDLDTFNRRSPGLRTKDRLRFLLAYCGQDKVDSNVRDIWRRLVAIREKKHRK